MLLEEEDCKLLNKIQEVLNSAEIKMNYELAGMGAVAQMNAAQRPSRYAFQQVVALVLEVAHG